MLQQLSRLRIYNKCKSFVVKPKKQEKKVNDVQKSGLSILDPLYGRVFIQTFAKSDSSKKINIEKLSALNIPNFAVASENGIRGETLSSRKNRRFLRQIKKYGITTVIDLRDKYKSLSLPVMCTDNGLKYYNIPIDSSSVPDEEIIKNLPLLFNLIDKGRFYMACAQGLHRTDIALSLNYVFNPASKEPPILRGHYRNGLVKFDDIARRLNSIKKNLTDLNIKQLGWDEKFEEQFAVRKKELYRFNKDYYSKTL